MCVLFLILLCFSGDGIKVNENNLLDQVKSVVLNPGDDGDNAGVAEADSPDPPEPAGETDYLGPDGEQVESSALHFRFNLSAES